jgi:hypothetical protein
MRKPQWILLRSISLVAVISLFCPAGLAQETVNTNPTAQTAKLFSMPIENLPLPNVSPATVTPPSSSSQQTDCGTRMSATDKLKYGFKQAFMNPSIYLFPAISATRQQLREESPNKGSGDNFADGLSRYAINYGTTSTKAIFTSGIYPIIFKQNPLSAFA